MKTDIEEEIAAALTVRMERWQRTFKSIAQGKAQKGKCVCPEKCGEAAGELDHSNPDCPVAIYLKVARLLEED
jgi:hypothetical protein